MAWEALDSEEPKCVPDSFMVGALEGQTGHSLVAEQAHVWN